MFYGADQVELALKCAFCKEKFHDVVKLVPECGCLICGKCFSDAREEAAAETGRYKCGACKETHSMPENGMLDCKQLLPLLQSQPLEKPLSENARKLKALIKEAMTHMEKLAAFDGQEFINEHCEQLEQDVRQTAASAIEHMRKIEANMLADIDEYRTRCLGQAADAKVKHELKALSPEVTQLDADWSPFFERVEVLASDVDIAASVDRVECFQAEMQSIERRMRNEALGEKLLVFKPNMTFLQRSNHMGEIEDLAPRAIGIIETPISTLSGKASTIWAVIHLPGGRLASSSDDKSIRIWSVKECQMLFKLKGHTGIVYALALLPNGQLVSGSHDSTIKIWDLEQKKEIRTLRGHTNMVLSLRLLTNGNLASLSNDNSVKVWNPYLEENHLLLTLTGHGHYMWIISIGILENGSLVTCSRDKYDKEDAILRVWNANDGQLVKEIPTKLEAARSLVVLRGDRVAIGYENGSIIIVDLKNDAESMTKEQAHDSSVNALAQLSNGNLISCGLDNWKHTIKLWTLPDLSLLQTIDTGHSKRVLKLSISSDETSLATTGEDSTIKLWTITH